MTKFNLSNADKEKIEKLAETFTAEHGTQSLFESAAIGNDLLTELLLEKGYRANAIDVEGKDPLWRTVESIIFEDYVFNENFKNVIRMLIEHGSDTKALDSFYCEQLDIDQSNKLDEVMNLVKGMTGHEQQAQGGTKRSWQNKEYAREEKRSRSSENGVHK